MSFEIFIMPIYSYKAKSLKGEEKQGVMEAENQYDLARTLRKDGYLLVSFKIHKAGKRFLNFSLRKIPLSQKLVFARNLGVMVSAGVSLPKALRILAMQTKNRLFKKAIEEVAGQVIKGESLSEAMLKHPRVFSKLFCSMIQVGEKTGNLDKVLNVLAFHLERDYKLRSKIKGAMIYPIVLLVATAGIGLIMLVKVVPRLSETFAELKIQLPPATRFIINSGNFFLAQWYLVLLLLIILPILFLAFLKSKQGKRVFDALILKTPFISGLSKKINSAYTARTLSSLIAGGVPIIEALKITSNSVTNFYFKKSILESAKKVQQGNKLYQVFVGYKNLYSPLFLEMIDVGEETGKTAEILTKLADFLEGEISNTTQNLSSVIEPILLLIMGGVVGFFAVSMIQPIYSMMNAM